eukprot:3615425-Amphidinium_carterae.1
MWERQSGAPSRACSACGAYASSKALCTPCSAEGVGAPRKGLLTQLRRLQRGMHPLAGAQFQGVSTGWMTAVALGELRETAAGCMDGRGIGLVLHVDL